MDKKFSDDPSTFYVDAGFCYGAIYCRAVCGDGSKMNILDDNFQPELFYQTGKETGYTDMHGNPVLPVRFDDFRSFRDEVRNASGFAKNQKPVCGMENIISQFITRNFAEKIKFENSYLKKIYLDIETSLVSETTGEKEFANPMLADHPITAITLFTKEDGWANFNTLDIDEDEIRKKFGNGKEKITFFSGLPEVEMLKVFVEYWKKIDGDVIIAWNSEEFDIPYIYNRIERKLGKSVAQSLSPFGFVEKRVGMNKFGKEFDKIKICGMTHFDLYKIYQKFDTRKKPSYKLDDIAEYELDRKKLDYSGYDDLEDFMLKNPSEYIRYNLIDVELVWRVDEKIRYTELAFVQSMQAHSIPENILSPTNLWDNLIYNKFHHEKKAIPLKDAGTNNPRKIEGAFVKSPIMGKLGWGGSLDATSMYPSAIMTNNISPDTMVHYDDLPDELKPYYDVKNIQRILDDPDFVRTLVPLLRKYNLAYTPNGAFYRKDFVGFYPRIIAELFDTRVSIKSEMKEWKKVDEKIKTNVNEKKSGRIEAEGVVGALSLDELKQMDFSSFDLSKLLGLEKYCENIIPSLDIAQDSTKRLMNSGYGALLEKNYRYFDEMMGESITFSGQLYIRFLERQINRWAARKLGVDSIDVITRIDTDSTVGSTRVLVSIDGEEREIEIERLFDEYADVENNQSIHKDDFVCPMKKDVLALGFDGDVHRQVFGKVNYIMKHKVKKEMFRITVDGDEVVCTCDHSLIVDRNGEIISVKPSDVGEGDFFIKLKSHCGKRYTDQFKIESLGEQELWVYDIEVDGCHNFFANNILIHNSLYLNFVPFIEKFFQGDRDNKEELHNFCAKLLKDVFVPFSEKQTEKYHMICNSLNPRMKMKHEKIFSSSFATGKKRYAFDVVENEDVVYAEPEVSITGFEAIKSSTPKFFQEKLKEAMTSILRNSESEFQDFVIKTKNEFFSGKVPVEEIGFVSSITDMDKYSDPSEIYKKGCPMHVRAALLFNHYAEKAGILTRIHSGDKIMMVKLRKPNYIKEDVIAALGDSLDRMGLLEDVDYVGMWDKLFVKALEPITDSIGWKIEKKNKLFFKNAGK